MGSKVFAVIDTNVIVSALISKNPESPPLLVLAHVYSGTITPVFNAEIIQEYRDVLSRKKPLIWRTRRQKPTFACRRSRFAPKGASI